MDRGGAIYLGLAGFKVENASLGRPPKPFYSVRMKALSQLDRNSNIRITGDGLTWDDLAGLKVPWGDATELRFTVPEPGWAYTWDIGLKKLIVTDNSGSSTAYPAMTLSDVGVSWDVLESSQFAILITAAFEPDVFLVCIRGASGRKIERNEYLWSLVDNYLSGLQHIVFDMMSDWSAGLGEDNPVIIDPGYPDGTPSFAGEWPSRDILLARVDQLLITGEFPVNLILAAAALAADRPDVTREGLLEAAAEALLIRLWAVHLLSGSDPIYEPWLLWPLFQWLYVRPVVVSRERIFDLSPWWG